MPKASKKAKIGTKSLVSRLTGTSGLVSRVTRALMIKLVMSATRAFSQVANRRGDVY